jgi:lysophospholipase L1-like esterase
MENGIVLIVGDSLACPRPWIGVDLLSTYGHILYRELGGRYFVANFAEGDNSTRRSIRRAFIRTYVEKSSATYAIIQLGIVDCAPRLLTDFERILGAIAARLRFLDPLFKLYVRSKSKYRYRLTRMFPNMLIGIDEFETNYRALLLEIITNNPVKKIFLISIACPGQMLREKSYGIDANIEQYNALLRTICDETSNHLEYIDLYSATKENPAWISADDGHHIHREAHAWIANKISARIREIDAVISVPPQASTAFRIEC